MADRVHADPRLTVAPEGRAGDADLGSPAGWETTFGSSRVVFGANALERLGELTRMLGGSRALVVTDAGLVAAGHLDRARSFLRDARIEVAVFDGVEPNPTTRHVAAALEVAREAGADCLVGLGGGSAMDCAKAVNFLLTNGGRMEDYQGTGRAAKPMLPSLGVPSTAGTGSEAQSYALIARADTGAKMACGDRKAMFRVVLLDPLVASSAPRDVVAASGIDAMAHAIESHVSTRRNPLSQLFSRDAWRRLAGSFEAVLADPTDLAAWGEMQLGAFFAGAAVEHSMLGAAHACANPLTARYPIAHGAAVGLMLPHVIRFNAAHAGRLYDELYRAALPEGGPGLIDQRVQELAARAGLPLALRDHQVPRERLPELAAEAERQWTGGFNPRPLVARQFLELYEAAW
jgi:alcohol dehydrogenase